MLPLKICSHCEKEFIPVKFISQRFCSISCRKAYHTHKSREKHLDKRKAYDKKYNKQNALIIATKTAIYRTAHKKEIQTWHNLHIVDIREHKKKRLKEDPNYKLRQSLANKVRQALKGTRKSQHTLELLGCSVEYLKIHLEALFQPGMTWNNWEQYGWHIDHKLPISSFNLVDPEQQKLCFHYTNLQPLWWLDNIRKSNIVNSTLQKPYKL